LRDGQSARHVGFEQFVEGGSIDTTSRKRLRPRSQTVKVTAEASSSGLCVVVMTISDVTGCDSGHTRRLFHEG